MRNSLKITALHVTPEGRAICERLRAELGVPVDVRRVGKGRTAATFKDAWVRGGIVAVMAAGIVVRAVAPLLAGKHDDPPVVVVDDGGRFAISLLSGHCGGANELAREVAGCIGATPVITTASDGRGIRAIDLHAADHGYVISDDALYRTFAQAQLAGRRISVYVEPGEPVAFFANGGFTLCPDRAAFSRARGLKLAVTWRMMPRTVLRLIPRTIVLGMGFHRGMTAGALHRFVTSSLAGAAVDVRAVARIATIDRRKGERGFAQLCTRMDAEPVYFDNEALSAVEGVGLSRIVSGYTGTGSVAEAAALLASGRGPVVIPKQKGEGVTLCAAREV